MLELNTIPVILEQNCCVIIEDGRAVVSDPGSDADRIKAFCDERGAVIEQIWLTHSHFDHAGGVAALMELCDGKPKLLGSRIEKQFRENIEFQLQMFGVQPEGMANCPEPDEELAEGELKLFEKHSVKVLFTPGHSPGHFSFVFMDAPFLLNGQKVDQQIILGGDTLFRGSIGRTDLMAGDYETLISSIKEKLLPHPEETIVLPGHGEPTTVGEEKRSNPFLKL